MNVKEFGERYRVRVNDRKFARKYRIDYNEDKVFGRFGEIVNDPSYGAFAVKFIAVPRGAVMTGALRNRFRAALAAGLRLKRKHGDAESTFHFDPANEQEARIAIKLVGAKRLRTTILTPERLVALTARLAAIRVSKTVQDAA